MTLSLAIVIIVLLSIFIGYFIGSINWAIIIGKYFYKTDPRNFESKNAGATNATRIFGKNVGFCVWFLDLFKGIFVNVLVFIIAKYSLNEWLNAGINSSFNPYALCYLPGFFCIIGHCFPIYFKFKGGKGVSTFAGIIWTISPFIGIFLFFFWILILKIYRKVYISSIATIALSLFLIFIPYFNYFCFLNDGIDKMINYNYVAFVFGLLLFNTLIIILKHWTNIHDSYKINKND